jgi:2-polyprenyl-6-hydroxyphenyl methylase/3-demethylubiquinone-9 3-methyltransferase
LEISKFVREIVGIDTARESITLAMALKEDDLKCTFYEMNAINLKFNSEFFDKVYCIQNGISAFGVNKKRLLKEALRVTKSGGKVIFSSYTKEFWPHRLEWFSLQAKNGLIGEIDFNKTGNGYIVCKDGFRAGYMREKGFEEICKYFGFKPHITKIDNSSLFCEIEKS